MKQFLILIFLLAGDMAKADDDALGEKLAWISGCWEGDGLGGQITECWVPSGKNRFTGVFQLMKDGEQQFSEIFILDVSGEDSGLRVKHFDSSFEQWKSDNISGHTFPFTSAGENHIQLEGLRYELIDENCHVTLDLGSGDTVNTVNFVLGRMN
jgi:hypothetical protein